MNIAQDDLNRWRSSCGRLRVMSRTALADLNTGNTAHARQVVEQTEEAARQMAMQLERAGADRPDAPPPSFESGVPLHLLDTPANRRYLETLRACYEAALAVDRERYGADIGTDGRAQIIEGVLADVEEEIGGPVGLVKE